MLVVLEKYTVVVETVEKVVMKVWIVETMVKLVQVL